MRHGQDDRNSSTNWHNGDTEVLAVTTGTSCREDFLFISLPKLLLYKSNLCVHYIFPLVLYFDPFFIL